MIQPSHSLHTLLWVLIAGDFSARADGTRNWPEFRGATGQGLSEAKNPPTSWTRQKSVAWKTPTPPGWASPVLVNGQIILAGARDEKGRTNLVVLRIDAESGAPDWERTVFTPTQKAVDARHAKNGVASATPVVKDGRIYAHFAHMGTAALDFNTGKVLWKQEQLSYPPMHGTGSSPVLVDDLLVFHADGAKDPELIALHADTGKIA